MGTMTTQNVADALGVTLNAVLDALEDIEVGAEIRGDAVQVFDGDGLVTGDAVAELRGYF